MKFQIRDVRVQRGINCGSDHYVVRAKVYLPIQGKANNMDKQEENQEKFMYPKYNLDSFQHESTVYLYLYQKRLDEKLTAKEESDLTEIYENNTKSSWNGQRGIRGKAQKTKP